MTKVDNYDLTPMLTDAQMEIVPVPVCVPVPETRMLSGMPMVLLAQFPGCLRALLLPLRY